MKKETLLIVDDQQEILNSLQRLFKADYNVLTASSGAQALELLKEYSPAVILSDQRMPEMDGVTFLKESIRLHPDAVRLMITGYADIEATIGAVNEANIYQYISKPFEPQELQKTIANAMERFRLVRQNQALQETLKRANKALTVEKEVLQRQVEQQLDLGNLIGSSPPMLHIFKLIKKVMNTPTTVLLLGDTGTGKEMLARIIHFNSVKKDKMFAAQNCGAIPDTLLQSELFGHVKGSFTGAVADKKGLFETADGGTVFLDEIGDTSPALQLNLLRVLQEGEIKPVGSSTVKKVEVRVIAATNKNLQEEVKAGRFREDLFYRLSVFPIQLPPLHERRQDIPELIRYFIQKYAQRIGKNIRGISKQAEAKLMRAEYPGNIRELENEIERLVTLADENSEIDETYLSPRFLNTDEAGDNFFEHFGGELNFKDACSRLEKTMIARALQSTSGNILRAAEELGLSRAGLHKMLKRHGIIPAKYKHGGGRV